jgi:hypothetical protein
MRAGVGVPFTARACLRRQLHALLLLTLLLYLHHPVSVVFSLGDRHSTAVGANAPHNQQDCPRSGPVSAGERPSGATSELAQARWQGSLVAVEAI